MLFSQIMWSNLRHSKKEISDYVILRYTIGPANGPVNSYYQGESI